MDGHARIGRAIDATFRVHTDKDEIEVWEAFWAARIAQAQENDYFYEHDHLGKRWLYEQVVETVKACAGGDLAGKSVAEIGCGSGYATMRMADHGAHPVLIDASENAIMYAQRLAARLGVEEQTSFLRSDFSHLPKDVQFDVVFNSGVLEHYEMGEACRMLRQMAAVTKPGGIILAIVPNLLSPTLMWRMASSGFKGSERFYSRWLLKRLFRQANLTPVGTGSVNAYLPVDTPLQLMKFFDRQLVRLIPSGLSALVYCAAKKSGD
ncbi:MAG: class I SAM-dependent methyltransferase [Erythrobacter sp.]|nr:class I SAM-dependent methyltransferase [Erythrobacter sp.]